MIEQRIIGITARVFGLEPEDLVQPTRKRCVVDPRHVATALTHQRTSLSLGEIARLFGHKSHATVLNSIKRVGDYCETEPTFRALVARIEGHLAGGVEAMEQLDGDIPFIYPVSDEKVE